MKNLTLVLIVAFIAIYTPLLHAKQMQCVINVVDTMGRPIKGAEVSVWGDNYDVYGHRDVEQLCPETHTDGTGKVHVRFELNINKYSVFVFAQKAGFSVAWNGIASGARIPEIKLMLDRINSTAGIVTNEQNQPIAGAKVTAYPNDEVMLSGAQSRLRWPDSILTTTTDHEGRFNFDCLAEWTTVSFIAECPGRACTDTRWNLQGQSLGHYQAGTKDIHITMHPAGQIKGKILAKRGQTIKGITLRAWGERSHIGKQFSAISDTDGSFTFSDLPPDTYLVTTVTAKDDPSQLLTVGAIAEVELGQTVENVKIRMRDPIQLDVLIKNAKTNQPIRNASVDIYQIRTSFATHFRFRAMADERGTARVITLPGKCSVFLDHDDYDFSSGEYLIRSTDTNLVIGLNPHSSVSGQVVYEDGRAAAGVEVAASPFETEHTLTDRNGRFRVRFSERVSAKAFVIARDVVNGLAGLVEITENKGPVKVVLEPAATVKGRVVDPDENPINMAKVSVTYFNIPCYMSPFGNPLYTDENGQFELRAVPYAQKNFGHLVSISALGYSETRHEKIDIKKEMGTIVELPPFVLNPSNMTVSGTVLYEDGSVAAHRSVNLNSAFRMQSQPPVHSVTDENGRFSIDGVCQGWMSIQCGYVSETTTGFIDAKGGDTVTVVLKEKQGREGLLLHSPVESLQGKKLPLYEMLTKGIDTQAFESKKLLVCFWYIGEEQSKKNIKALTDMVDEFEQADIAAILVNAWPYNKKNASINIDIDKKWLADNNVPFIEADMPHMENIMDFRRATGARFIPHMILTDENKIVTHEGFDIEWLKDHVLAKEDI